ncbi:hypothetical protein ACF0H5_020083 [Mactra antiquata]
MIYLDYNATTPLEQEVTEAIVTALTDAWGNPSSSHEAGIKAKEVIDNARQNVASMIGTIPSNIIFTSGGTEANNMILQSAIEYYKQHYNDSSTDIGDTINCLPHIISSCIEHPAINEYLKYLQHSKQAEVSYVPISSTTGRLEVTDVIKHIKSNTIMVTVMLANNETGIIQPVKEICHSVKSLVRHEGETQNILVHTDAAQAIGKISVDIRELNVDYLTVVGHKFYGPRNGAMYVKGLDSNDVPLYPMLYGGGQERSYRPGTENTGMIAGLGKACELVSLNREVYEKTMLECRNYLENKLEEYFPGRVHFNGKFEGTERLPNTCNVSILGEKYHGYKVLSRCKILQASVGAACHSQNKPSSILLAIGIDESIARNAIRISVGRSTTTADIDRIVEDIYQAIQSIDQE